jgi:hypothetical protein
VIAALQPDLFEPDELPQDSDDTTHTAAVLYRCRPCERLTRRPHVWRRTLTRSTSGQLAGITWALPDGRTHRGEQPPADACGSCKRQTAGTAIRGTYSSVHACDARCIYAKGPDCECSCGGANHGVGHARR